MYKMLFLLCGLMLAFSAFPQPPKSYITVSLPEGWAKVQGSVPEHQYLKNGASFMVKEETVLNGKTLNAAVAVAKQQIGKFFTDAVFAPNEPMKIDGHDACSMTFCYSAKAGNLVMKMKMLSVYVMVGTKCQTISFGSFADQFEQLSADKPKILQSIKFNN